ncbi:hypothetical protein OROGR_026503 [Orobanche gracilis]
MQTFYPVVETRPPLPARRSGYGGKCSDMVEQMQYLYVSVVKAKGLPVNDQKGSSIDPYVEVKVGNHRAVTKHFENNPSPVWQTTFAFSKQEIIMQSTSSIEVTVRDKKNNEKAAAGCFLGKVLIGMSTVAQRMPHESHLAPEWYQLQDRERRPIKQAQIMLAVWMGTQADTAFNNAHNTSMRSKVYFSPKLHYIRAHIITAQGVVPPPDDRVRVVRVQLGRQVRYTRPLLKKPIDPERNVDEELMFVTSEPFDERIDVSVADKIGPGKGEVTLGSISIPVRAVKQRIETSKPPEGQWYALSKPKQDDNNNKKKKEEEKPEKKPEEKIGIKIGLCRDSGYHVLDESTHYSSDFQPSANHLRKPITGVLEVGILRAEHLLLQMNKDREGKMTGGAYCVAKYGNKWVRTRTLINTPRPHWNEQYTWDVFDPCTVITVGVFNDCHTNINNDVKRDQSIGKVRIRLSTLETNRIYTLSYPLLVLSASGLKKHGELHLAVRFTCTDWANMVAQYREPLLPKMHYVQPISLGQMAWLRNQAMQIVGEKLSLAEPPLRREIVEYMLDGGVDHMWSLRRSKANFYRIMSLISWIPSLCTWFEDVCCWRNPLITALVYVLFLLLVCYPELILPTVFLYFFVTGVRNYRLRPRLPAHVDARLSQAGNSHPDELDEESDMIPTSRKPEVVKMRYDRLRSVAGRVQNVIGDLATQGERGLSLLSWRDPRATSVFIIFSVISAVLLYVVPFQAVVLAIGFYVLRHPRFRTRSPSVPLNFFKRLPARSDFLL